MRIFNSEIHDTALVFICLNIFQCSVYSFITMELELPSAIGRKEALIIVWFAVVFSLIYWLANYANTHFKNNHNENES
jgi:energy-coupling factor transporter transmembrane protein EcfT